MKVSNAKICFDSVDKYSFYDAISNIKLMCWWVDNKTGERML